MKLIGRSGLSRCIASRNSLDCAWLMAYILPASGVWRRQGNLSLPTLPFTSSWKWLIIRRFLQGGHAMAETENPVTTESVVEPENTSPRDPGVSAGDRWWWIITVGILLWIGFCSVAVLVYLGRH